MGSAIPLGSWIEEEALSSATVDQGLVYTLSNGLLLLQDNDT